MKRAYMIHSDSQPPYRVVFGGRVAWFLDELIAAGAKGRTSMDYPGVRISDNALKLRRGGVLIETHDEEHGGRFAGRHGRYTLTSKVERVADGGNRGQSAATQPAVSP